MDRITRWSLEPELVAVQDFDFDPETTHELGYDRLDIVAVLRRR